MFAFLLSLGAVISAGLVAEVADDDTASVDTDQDDSGAAERGTSEPGLFDDEPPDPAADALHVPSADREDPDPAFSQTQIAPKPDGVRLLQGGPNGDVLAFDGHGNLGSDTVAFHRPAWLFDAIDQATTERESDDQTPQSNADPDAPLAEADAMQDAPQHPALPASEVQDPVSQDLQRIEGFDPTQDVLALVVPDGNGDAPTLLTEYDEASQETTVLVNGVPLAVVSQTAPGQVQAGDIQTIPHTKAEPSVT